MSSIDVAINLIARDVGAASIFAGIGQAASAMAQQMLGTGASAQQLAQRTAEVGAAAITAKILFDDFSGALKDGMDAAGNLESALVRVKIATQTNSDAMPILTQAINDLAIKTVFASDEAAGAFERMNEKGFTVSQTLYGLGASADEYKQHAYDATEATNGLGYQALVLAQALKSSATDGADLLAAALRTFSNDSLSATDAANLLAGAYFNGVPSATALTQAIQMGGAQASTAGISMRDYLTTLDLLAQSGMSASSAGASLNYMIQAMIDPTAKQARMMSDLGIMVANEATPAFKNFTDELVKNGGATSDQIKLWSGSVTGLQDMFKAAQGVGMIGLDENFNRWALSAGYLKNNLFDAQGNFIGLKGGIDILNNAMNGMTVEEKMNALGDLFNIRSGRAARILTDLQGFDDQYTGIWQKMGNTDVTKAASDQLNTFQGAVGAFKDSLTSSLAVAIMPFLQALTPLVLQLNNLLGWFMNAPTWVHAAFAGFLIGGTVLSALALAVIAVVGVFALLTLTGATVGGILAAIGIVLAIVVGGALLVGGAFALLTGHTASVGNALQGIWNLLQLLWNGLIALISPALSFVAGLFHGLGESLQSFGGTLMAGKELWDKLYDKLAGYIRPVFEDVRIALAHVGDSLAFAKPGLDMFLGLLSLLGNILGWLLGQLLNLAGVILGGLLGALKGLWDGVSVIFGGIVQIISGALTIVFGIIGTVLNVIHALFTGHVDQVWSILQTGWYHIWNGIQDILSGIVHMIMGLGIALLEGLVNLVVGLVTGIIHWFQHLFDILVGHSIIPDMIRSIIDWFLSLPGKVLELIISLVTQVISWAAKLMVDFQNALGGGLPGILAFFGSLPGRVMELLGGLLGTLLGFGGDMMGHLADGITDGIGRVLGAIGNLKDKILNGLGGIKDAAGNALHNIGIPGFAAGGTVPYSGLFMVGENGPELMALPSGTQIYSNYDSMRLLDQRNRPIPVSGGGGGGGGGPIHVHVHIGNDQVGEYVIDQIGGALRPYGINRLGR